MSPEFTRQRAEDIVTRLLKEHGPLGNTAMPYPGKIFAFCTAMKSECQTAGATFKFLAICTRNLVNKFVGIANYSDPQRAAAINAISDGMGVTIAVRRISEDGTIHCDISPRRKLS